MQHNDFNQFCKKFKGAHYIMQWRGAHIWKVGGKVFAIGFTLKNNQTAYTFKTSEQNYYFLNEKEGYQPAPYFASRGMKWIQQIDTSGTLDEELNYYLSESYRLVLTGISKAKRQKLGLLEQA